MGYKWDWLFLKYQPKNKKSNILNTDYKYYSTFDKVE